MNDAFFDFDGLTLDGEHRYDPGRGQWHHRVAFVATDLAVGQVFRVEVATFHDEAGALVGPGACELIDGTCEDHAEWNVPPCGRCYYCLVNEARSAGLEVRHHDEPLRVSHRLAWDEALADVASWCDEQDFLAAETVALLSGRSPQAARQAASVAVHEARMSAEAVRWAVEERRP